jgi:hypothetical protein
MRQHTRTFLMRALVLLTLLSVAAAGVGCGSDKANSDVNQDVAAMMKKIPRGTDVFGCFDIKAMRGDGDLAPLYEALTGEWDAVYQTLGMPRDSMDTVGTDGEDTVVIEGRFDLDEVRDVLDGGAFVDHEYLDVQIWETGETGVALVSDNCIVFQTDGDIEDCVDAMKGERASVYDDEDIAETMGRLPDGLFVVYGAGREGPFSNEDYDGLEATAVSVAKRDADSLWMVVLFQFEDEDSADDAFDDIKDDMTSNTEGVDAATIVATQDGRYVEVTADGDMGLFSS